MAAFTSVSTEDTVSASFGDTHGDSLFYVIRNACGVDISSLSDFPTENEILLSPPAVFRIEAAFRVNNILTVTLMQVEQKTAFYCSFAAYDTEDLFQRGLHYYNGSNIGTPDYFEAVRYFRLAADEKHREAIYRLGKCYKDGTGVDIDVEEAVRQYSVAEEGGHIQARHELALCKLGEGVGQDYGQAVQWFQRNAETGVGAVAVPAEILCVVTESQLQLGLMYKEGKVARKPAPKPKSGFWLWGRSAPVLDDAALAFQWFQRAAQHNNVTAQLELALCYYHGRGTNQQFAEAVRLFQLLADTAGPDHVASAQFWLAECYRYGTGVGQNYGEAVRLYKLAVAQGHDQAQIHLAHCFKEDFGVDHEIGFAEASQRLTALNIAEAQFELGLCYLFSLGTRQEFSEACRLFRLAAESNIASAQYWLGVCFRHGYGVEKDLSEAVKLYKLAAGQGYDCAQHELGRCYDEGIGVEPNYAEALRWYQLAALQNYTWSLENLGHMYYNGKGVPRDYAEAVRYHQLAIDKGNTTGYAHYSLGVCYQYGHGVTKDLTEALRLYRIAACYGDWKALAKVRELESALK